MAIVTRESIFQALFALGSSLTWTNAAGNPAVLAYAKRRVVGWDNVAKPAMCQVEHREQVMQTTGLPSKRTMRAEWWLYLDEGADPELTPTTSVNNLLDAVEATIGNTAFPQQLGGLVHHCWIDGEILKVAGDLPGGQGIVIVPISILVP